MLEVQDGEKRTLKRFEHVVVCSGCFSNPLVPDFPGSQAFEKGGGKILHTSEFHEAASVQGKNVLVVGYGRSACDVAAAVCNTSEHTTLVARKIIWKLPRKIANLINYKYLFVTRFGESLFEYIHPSYLESFMNGWGSWIRRGMFQGLTKIVSRQLDLVEVGLLPEGNIERIATSSISLSTEGFFDKVKSGEKLSVKRDVHIARLYVSEKGYTMSELSSGEEIRADVIVCGTGYHQHAPFLPEHVQRMLTDENGNWTGLYRHILPVGIKNLTFNGFNGNLLSATTSEVASLWIAAHLERDYLALPSIQEQKDIAMERLTWLNERANGKTNHGLNTSPFSIRPIDDLMEDLRITLPITTLLAQWLLPFDPSAYRNVSSKLKHAIAINRVGKCIEKWNVARKQSDCYAM